MRIYSEKLIRILSASGWSQGTLADRLNVSFVTMNKWVNGKAEPRTGAKERIDVLFAEILGTDETDVVEVERVKDLAISKKLRINELLTNRKLLDAMAVDLTYHSNATEGSTMTENDVEAVIFDHKVLRNRTAIEQREAINHQVALMFLLDELREQGRSFTISPGLIRATHLRLMNGILANAGEYRNHGARISGAYVPLANFVKIPMLMEQWSQRVNTGMVDPIAMLATSHAEFERIHPFSDGNGRTGRLTLFVLALSLGLVPPIIKKERRVAYYKYLELCQTRELSDPLEKFIAEAIIETGELVEGLI